MIEETYPKVTLKDIASQTGYSLVSVHRAISGKNGVSEQTREKILDAAQKMGYEVNLMASMLKRKQVNIAICLPDSQEYGAYYYSYMWKGCRTYIAEYANYHVNFIECPFEIPKDESREELPQLVMLDRIHEQWGDDLDGLLTVPVGNTPEVQASIERFIKGGVEVVLIDNDFPSSGRRCCIAPNDENTGRLSAELMCSMVHQKTGAVLVAAGNESSLSHRMNAMGFTDYMRTHRPELSIITVNDSSVESKEAAFYSCMQNTDVVAAYSVRARSTIPLCNAALRIEAYRKVLLLGSDLFPDSANMLRRGVLKGIVYKNPYQKGYLGMKVLVERLLINKLPEKDNLSVPISVILRNNLMFFEEFI